MTTKQTKPTVHTDEIFEMQDLFESERIPNIVVATDGAALAFARTGRLLRRSEDGGQTWSPIQRPKDPDAQKAHYSGKKKQHTVKNNLLITAEL